MSGNWPVPVVVPGHGLRDEGKPFWWSEHRQEYVRKPGCDSEGQALCRCGEFSGVLPTDAARKRWHRAHKEEVWQGQLAKRT